MLNTLASRCHRLYRKSKPYVYFSRLFDASFLTWDDRKPGREVRDIASRFGYLQRSSAPPQQCPPNPRAATATSRKLALR